MELDVTSGSHTMPVAPRTNNEGPFPESLHQNAAGKRVGEVASGTNYPAGVLSNWKDKLATGYKGMFWTEANKPDEATIMKLAFINQVPTSARAWSEARCSDRSKDSKHRGNDAKRSKNFSQQRIRTGESETLRTVPSSTGLMSRISMVGS